MQLFFREVLRISFVGIILLASATIATASNGSGNKVILVNPDLPLSPAQLRIQRPAFTPFAPAAASKITTKRGNWKYQLVYNYDSQGWRLTKFVAHRIHKSNLKPIPYNPTSTPQVRQQSFCPPTKPNVMATGQPDVTALSCGGQTNGLPDLGRLPPPEIDPGDGGKITITYPPDTPGAGGWTVTIEWVAVPIFDAYGNIIGWEWVPKKVVATR